MPSDVPEPSLEETTVTFLPNAVPPEETTVTYGPDAVGETVDVDLPVTPEDLPGTMAMVVVKRGPNAGSKFTLDASVTLAGRHPDADIFLDDITVSRRHAEILRIDGGYVVKDVGSLNGTYLNRERIDEAVLATGDELQIGKFRLVFFMGSPLTGEGSE